MPGTGPYEVEWLGTRYRILLSASETGGNIGVFESLDQPGSGPPRHIHEREDETFHVQAGQVEFWVSGQSITCEPGAVMFVPRGTEHAFRVVGDEPARMLTMVTPGGFEGFFAEVAAKGCRVPEDMGVLAEIGSRFNLALTGPPLGREKPGEDVGQVFYSSSNGDRWLIIRDLETGDAFIRHQPNRASGGQSTDIDLKEFLTRDRDTPQCQALIEAAEEIRSEFHQLGITTRQPQP